MAAGAILWLLALDLSPLSTSLGSNNARALVYDVAYLAAVAGSIVGGWRLGSLEWLVARTCGAARDALWFTWVSLASLLPAGLTLLPWIALGGSPSLPGVASIVLTCFHLAALTLLLKSSNFSKGERSLVIALLAVGLQGSLHGESGALLLVSRVFDPSPTTNHDLANLPLYSIQLASICGLILLSGLMRSWRRSAK